MVAFTADPDVIDGMTQMGIEVDSVGTDIEPPGQAGKTRPVKYLTLYMTAPPYKAISVKETMVPSTLGKRHKDKARPALIGQPVFSRTPVHEVEQGHSMCLLHPERPERPLYQSMGLPPCMTSSFASEYEVERHMQTKHKNEWKAIQALTEKGEKAEAKTIQQATLEAMQAQSAALFALAQGGGIRPQATMTVADHPVKTEPVLASEKKVRAIPAQLHCEDCEYVTPEGHGAPQFPLGKHRKEMHPAT